MEPHIGTEWPVDITDSVTVHLFGEGAQALVAHGNAHDYYLRHGNVVIEGIGSFSTTSVALTRRLSNCIPSSNQTRLIYQARVSPKSGYDAQVTFFPDNRANCHEATLAIYEAVYGKKAPEPVPVIYV